MWYTQEVLSLLDSQSITGRIITFGIEEMKMKSKPLYAAFTIILSCAVPLKITASDKSLMANIEAGKLKSVLCSGCHGLNGEGKIMPDGQPAIPLLAGQIPGYFVKSIYDYKMDKRLDPVMNAITKGLTDVDIANLAAYYASLK
jgi:cytochrome c553